MKHISKKIIVIAIIYFFFTIFFSDIVYSVGFTIDFNTIKFENINDNTDVYILINKDTNFEIDNNLNILDNFTKKINKDTIYIERQYLEENIPKQLENSFEEISLYNKTYIKFKIIEDISISWFHNENILFAIATENGFKLINLDEIQPISYFDKSSIDFGKETINRKSIIYNSSLKNITDQTQDDVNIETEILSNINKKNESKRILQERLLLIIFIFVFFIIIPIFIGLLVDKLLLRYKKKKNQ